MSHDQVCAPCGRSMIPTRKAANAPNFIKTPAWNMETAVGAATCPSGDQLWKGQIPPKTAKPRKTGRNQIFWKDCEKPAFSISNMSNESTPVFLYCSQYMASTPTKETTEPIKRYRVS